MITENSVMAALREVLEMDYPENGHSQKNGASAPKSAGASPAPTPAKTSSKTSIRVPTDVTESLRELTLIEEKRIAREREQAARAKAEAEALAAKEAQERADQEAQAREKEERAERESRERRRRESALRDAHLEKEAILRAVPEDLRKKMDEAPSAVGGIVESLCNMAELHEKTVRTQRDILLGFIDSLPAKSRSAAMNRLESLLDGKLFGFFPNEMQLLADQLTEHVLLLQSLRSKP